MVYDAMQSYTSGRSMRTNIDIDDALIAEAMAATGHSTKKGVVEEALRQIVAERRAREALQDLRGIGWDGDREAMRRQWAFEPASRDGR